jgi:hypothetical protein
MQEVAPCRKNLIVEALCCASEAASIHHEVAQAEMMALQAVSRARFVSSE